MENIYVGMKESERKMYTKKDFVQMKAALDAGLMDKKSYSWFYIQYLMNYIKYRIREKAYCKEYQDYEDLICEGITAIVENIDRYDPRIASPTTFFTPYIDERIKKVIEPAEMSRYYGAMKEKLSRAARMAGYEDLNDSNLSDYLLSALSGVPLSTISETRRQSHYTVESIDDYNENIMDERNTSPEDILVKKEEVKFISDALLKCTPMERFLLLAVEVNKNSLRKVLDYLKTEDINKTDLRNEVISKMTQDYLSRKLHSGIRHMRDILGYDEDQMLEKCFTNLKHMDFTQSTSILGIYDAFFI